MLKRVIRFRAIVNPQEPDDGAEAAFIRDGLPALLSATEGLRQFCHLSRHQNGDPGEKDSVWLVCKPRRGKCEGLESAGRRSLNALVANGAAGGYRIEVETDETALSEAHEGILGVPRYVSYETCWRYLDAATRVAIEMLLDPSSEAGRTLAGSAPVGPEPKLRVGWHLAHFFWNALGLKEASAGQR